MVKYIPPLFEPYKSRIRANRAISYQAIPAYSEVKVEFNAKTYDGLGEFDEVTNYRFTAKKAGYYLVHTQLRWTSLVVDEYYASSIKKNNVMITSNDFRTPTTLSYMQAFSDIVYLSAGDYIEVFVYNGSGTEARLTPNGPYTILAIHKLSE